MILKGILLRLRPNLTNFKSTILGTRNLYLHRIKSFLLAGEFDMGPAEEDDVQGYTLIAIAI